MPGDLANLADQIHQIQMRQNQQQPSLFREAAAQYQYLADLDRSKVFIQFMIADKNCWTYQSGIVMSICINNEPASRWMNDPT